jgi:hypothetical protein
MGYVGLDYANSRSNCGRSVCFTHCPDLPHVHFLLTVFTWRRMQALWMWRLLLTALGS